MRKFKKVYVEITNVCNLNCAFCPGTNRSPAFMSNEQFEHICKQVKQFSNYIYLHLMGEPFLVENISDFLKIAYENQLQVNITSNGTLISSASDYLLTSPALRKVSFSLHSFEGNLSSLSNADLSITSYLNPIFNFCDQATSKGIICELRLWNENSELSKYNTFIINKIIEYFNLFENTEIKNALNVGQNKNGTKLRDKLYVGNECVFNWPDENKEIDNHKTFCLGLRDQFGILVDGTVVPCCLDNNGTINLGNIFKNNLSEILFSNRANALYNGFSNGIAVEKLCKSCTFVK